MEKWSVEVLEYWSAERIMCRHERHVPAGQPSSSQHTAKILHTIQKRLDEKANQNLKEYVENAHRHVQEMAETGFTVQYGTRTGGYEHVSPVPQHMEKNDALIEA